MTRRGLQQRAANDSNVFKNVNSESLIAFDSDVVHLSGNETLSGYKTFANDIYVGDTSLNNVRITQTDIRKMVDGSVKTYALPSGSGTLATQEWTTESTRYSLVSATQNDSNQYVLSDMAINAVTASENSEFVFPPKIQGKARDFFVRLTITSEEIPQITFEEPDGSPVSFDVADGSWAEIQQGVNLIMFTETAQ